MVLPLSRIILTDLPFSSYWGQDGAGSQQRLSFYCADDTINVIPLAFLYIFRGTGGQPVVDLGDVRPKPTRNSMSA